MPILRWLAVAKGFIKKSNKYVEGDYVKGNNWAKVGDGLYTTAARAATKQPLNLKLPAPRTRPSSKTGQEANARVKEPANSIRVSMKTATMKALPKQLAYWGLMF